MCVCVWVVVMRMASGVSAVFRLTSRLSSARRQCRTSQPASGPARSLFSRPPVALCRGILWRVAAPLSLSLSPISHTLSLIVCRLFCCLLVVCLCHAKAPLAVSVAGRDASLPDRPVAFDRGQDNLGQSRQQQPDHWADHSRWPRLVSGDYHPPLRGELFIYYLLVKKILIFKVEIFPYQSP